MPDKIPAWAREKARAIAAGYLELWVDGPHEQTLMGEIASALVAAKLAGWREAKEVIDKLPHLIAEDRSVIRYTYEGGSTARPCINIKRVTEIIAAALVAAKLAGWREGLEHAAPNITRLNAALDDIASVGTDAPVSDKDALAYCISRAKRARSQPRALPDPEEKVT